MVRGGIAIGAGVGLLFGLMLGNVMLGAAVGTVAGLLVGAVIQARRSGRASQTSLEARPTRSR